MQQFYFLGGIFNCKRREETVLKHVPEDVNRAVLETAEQCMSIFISPDEGCLFEVETS